MDKAERWKAEMAFVRSAQDLTWHKVNIPKRDLTMLEITAVTEMTVVVVGPAAKGEWWLKEFCRCFSW